MCSVTITYELMYAYTYTIPIARNVSLPRTIKTRIITRNGEALETEATITRNGEALETEATTTVTSYLNDHDVGGVMCVVCTSCPCLHTAPYFSYNHPCVYSILITIRITFGAVGPLTFDFCICSLRLTHNTALYLE